MVVLNHPVASRLTDATPCRPQNHSSIEGTADLDELHTAACAQLTRCLLSAASSVPAGEHVMPDLKNFILFIAYHDCATKNSRTKTPTAGLLEC